MTQQTKSEIYAKYENSYNSLSKKEKSEVITIIEEMTEHSRKHVIRRLLNKKKTSKSNCKKTGRVSKYSSPIISNYILDLWKQTQNICSRRLKEAIVVWMPYYEEEIPEDIKTKLKEISASSIERILRVYRKRYGSKWKVTTKPGSLLKTHIPIHKNKWDESKPGFVEADTVSHGGGSCSGSYAYTVVITDIATSWVESRAVWEKGHANMDKAIRDIEASLPFPLLGFDSDNGSEFLNHYLYKYFTNRKNPVCFTRSRPYHSNDNAHVEQKNWTHIRQYIGYERFDNIATIDKLNDIYKNYLCKLMNYFMPSEQVEQKIYKEGKLYKKMGIAKTPYQRVCKKANLTPDEIQRHEQILIDNNPYKLVKEIKKRVKMLYTDYDGYSSHSGDGEV